MDYKSTFGLVETPENFVCRMIDLIDDEIFENKDNRWLDAGAGRGIFSFCLTRKLSKLEEHKKENTSQIDLIEINEEFRCDLESNFENVFIQDYLNFSNGKYDVIIGNPPYNRNGLKKVPTNRTLNKKEDGQTLWINFLYKSLEILKPGGTLCYVIPSIWMKNNHIVYRELLKYKIEKIIPYSNTESNKIFSGNCQTPTCILVLKKEQGDGCMNIYDKIKKDFILYDSKFSRHLPLVGIDIVSIMYNLCEKYGSISKYVKKTNVISKKISVSGEKTQIYKFKNIETCLLNKTEPYLKINYSNHACPFYGEKKIVLSHKMYGFPYMDHDGEFGVSKRDNYVISGLKNKEDYKVVFDMLSSNIVFFLMDTTRYRMKYLEKYVFDFIPDILTMRDEGYSDVRITFDVNFINLNDSDNEYYKNFNCKYKHFDFETKQINESISKIEKS